MGRTLTSNLFEEVAYDLRGTTGGPGLVSLLRFIGLRLFLLWLFGNGGGGGGLGRGWV